jgi:hypothetical protein
MMMKMMKMIFIMAFSIVICSCKIQVESEVPLSTFLKQKSDEITVKIYGVSSGCEYWRGTYVWNSVCKKEKEVHYKLPVVKYPDVTSVKESRFGFYYGKNDTLILFLRTDTLKDIQEQSKNLEGGNFTVTVQIKLSNDTHGEIKLKMNNVWVENSIGLGHELKEYTIEPGETLILNLSDTSVFSLMNQGYEPIVGFSLRRLGYNN